MSSLAAPEPHVVEDCRGVLQLMSDGTVRRSAEPAFPVDVPEDNCGVEWKDVTWDAQHDLNARLYRPRQMGAANDARIPVVAYFHGGGFCIGSGRWPNFHTWSLRLCSELPSVVLSFDYRLAPEHRLPAAQEDGARAMIWLRSAATDPWIADAADFARVFVAGDSAGGNIAHHVAVALGKSGLGPPVVRIRGALLLGPAMAGESCTRAELECPRDAFLTTEMCDRYARLALPDGADRDDPVISPAGPRAPGLEAMEMAPVLVVAGGRDVTRDRNKQYARRMKEEWGKEVEYVEVADADHGFFVTDPWSQRADELVRVVRRFVVEHMDAE
jgi:acetyl esterase/lipase